MKFTKLGCLSTVSAIFFLLVWNSFEEVFGSSSPNVQTEMSVTKLPLDSEIPSSATLEPRRFEVGAYRFWKIFDVDRGCLHIPRISKIDLRDDVDTQVLRVSQISATVSVYRKDKPGTDLPVTADSVLVPLEDFAFSTEGGAKLGPIVTNDEICDVLFLSETGKKHTLQQLALHALGKTRSNVAILQLYIHYADETGFVKHTTSLFLRSDSDEQKLTLKI